MPDFWGELLRFIKEFFSHWQSYATGGVVTGIIGIVERLSDKRLSKRAYFSVFVVTFSMAAFFMVWRDQFERAEGLQARLNQKPQQPIIQVNVPPPTVIIQGPAEAKKEVPGPSEKKKTEKSNTGKEAAASNPNPAPEDRAPRATQPPPQPSVAHVRIASQKTVTSTDAEFPFKLEVVLQTDSSIEPVAFGLICNGDVGKGDAGFTGGGAYMQTKSGQLDNNAHMWGFEWKYPAFTAADPIVVNLYSKEHIEVTGLQEIRYVWP